LRIESTTNDYLRSKDCELIQIGGIIDDKGYGIAAPSGSPWVNIISNAILQLKTYGELPELYQKWWKKEYKSTNCDMYMDKRIAHELGLSKLGGVFIIVAFVTCLSFLILLIEILWNLYKTSKDKVNTNKYWLLISRGEKHLFFREKIIIKKIYILENLCKIEKKVREIILSK
jgi:hypothetical protein